MKPRSDDGDFDALASVDGGWEMGYKRWNWNRENGTEGRETRD